MSDPGYFSDDSMIRRVMRKRAVGLTYGQRALVVGAVNPLLYVGTAEHTEHRTTPYTRLAITGRLFEAVALGTRPRPTGRGRTPTRSTPRCGASCPRTRVSATPRAPRTARTTHA